MSLSTIRLRSALLLLAVTSAPAWAETKAPGSQPARPEGEYGGVVPGKGAPPRRGRPVKPTLTWVGFQSHDGGARVFLQTNVPVTYTQVVVGKELIVSVPEVALGPRNNGRPLDTSYFKTPITRVTVSKRSTGGVDVKIEFKDAAQARQAQASSEAGADGFQYLYLDFGAGE